MASTNKTTNYELSQFIETDRPAWLTDYNGDMRTIDSTMKAISDVASGASGSISELADRMSTAEGNISTNTNDISTLDARADSLEAQAQSTAGTIANIQTEQTAQNLGIEAATELGYNLARPYDSASTYAVGDYVLFQNTLYKCITAVPVGEAFDATKWLAIKATDEISGGGYTLPIASASQLGGVKVGNGLSIDPLTGVLSASGGGTKNVIYTNDPATAQSHIHPQGLDIGADYDRAVDYKSFYYIKMNDLNILTLQFSIRAMVYILKNHEANLDLTLNFIDIEAPQITGNEAIPVQSISMQTVQYPNIATLANRAYITKNGNDYHLSFVVTGDNLPTSGGYETYLTFTIIY